MWREEKGGEEGRRKGEKKGGMERERESVHSPASLLQCPEQKEDARAPPRGGCEAMPALGRDLSESPLLLSTLCPPFPSAQRHAPLPAGLSAVA